MEHGVYATTQAQTVEERDPGLKPWAKMPLSLAQATEDQYAPRWSWIT